MEKYCTKCGKLAKTVRPSLFMCDDGHENWINPPVGAVAFVVHNDKVVYGIRSREPGAGKLCLPGGILEIGDSAEATIVREAKEELGIDITIIAPFKTYATSYDNRPILNIVFIARAETNVVVPGDDMDGGEPVWHDVTALPAPDESAWEWYTDAQADFVEWWRKNRQLP